jgi:uncharacterized protein YaaQ
LPASDDYLHYPVEVLNRAADIFCSTVSESSNRPGDDLVQYPVEVLNRAADIFRMAGHMLGERLLLFLLHRGLVVDVVDDGRQIFPRRRD